MKYLSDLPTYRILLPFLLMPIIVWLIGSSRVRPIKICRIIMMVVSVNMSLIWLSSCLSWVPLLFLALFIGGLTMVYSILSSVLPNFSSQRKIFKPSKYYNLIILLVPLTISFRWTQTEQTIQSSRKEIISSSYIIARCLLILSSYIGGCTLALFQESVSLRSFYT